MTTEQFTGRIESGPPVAVTPAAAGAGLTSRTPGGAAAGSPAAASRLPSLTGLRAPIALAVFLFHAALPFPSIRLFADDSLAHGFYRAVAQVGGLTMPFWFALSGFILVWSYRGNEKTTAWWRRRYVKIVPPYIAGWILARVLVEGVDGSHTTLAQGFLSFFMLQSWVPDVPTNFAVNNVGWSLSTEAFFYLVFPVVYPLVRRIPAQRLKYWIGGVVLAVCAVPLITYAVIPVGTAVVPNEPAHSANYFWFAYIFPPARLLDFVLGMLVARAVLTGRWRNIGMVGSGALLAVSYVVALNIPMLWGLRVACLVPAVMVIAAGAMADSEGRRSIFQSRFAVWLGDISFAFYCVHFTVLELTRKLLGDRLFSTPATIGLLVGQLTVSVLLAWALFAFVERPVTRRFSRSRRARARSAARMPEPARM
ncbi:acyltransferase family protein [Streptomyces shenzhenensis]|uniref:acyltransferase family protein n=1 Tax=Streptomyces shenzhenensis TaxID=943815 RepID=UPI001F24DB21|nr:acyltransferase [Streptomyces shenzhenensis]